MEKAKTLVNIVPKPLSIFLSVVITVGIIAISIPHFQDMEFIKSFISNALATIVGAICGLFIVLWVNDLERSRSKDENEAQMQASREKVVRVLIDDLQHNRDELQKHTSPKESDAFVLRTTLKIESWKALSNGGELQAIRDPEVIHRLADMFDKTSSVIYLLELLTDFGSGRGSYRSINSLAIPDQAQEMISALCKELDSFLKDFKHKV
jgi:hypothetical protein